MSEGEREGAGYYDARNCLIFNEHRRLYMGVGDDDSGRLAGIYGMPEAELRRVVADCEARLGLAAARIGPAPDALRAAGPILFIGDSNSAYRLSYVNVLRALLEGKGVGVVDTSIPGLSSQDVVDHFADQVLERSPRVAAVMIGTNDVRRSCPPGEKNITGLPEFEANMRFILGGLDSVGARTLVLTIPPIDSDRMHDAFAPCGWTADPGDIASYTRPSSTGST